MGAQRIRLLLQHVDHPQDIFRLDREQLQSIYGIGPKTAEDIVSFDDWSRVDDILTKTERVGAQLMTYWDDEYPPLLREIYDPPILLWINGNRKALRTNSIDRKSTRLNSSHVSISYAVFCLKKKRQKDKDITNGI